MQQLRKLAGPSPRRSWRASAGRWPRGGLAAIHEATDEEGRPLNILHRDVTPGNILLTREGNAKLIDLCIAKGAESRSKPTEIGTIRGTARYLAPELLDGHPHSPASDLWALGVVLFEAVLGRRAAEGDTREVIGAIARRSIRELLPGEVIEPRHEEGLFALLAEKNERQQRARAAPTCSPASRPPSATARRGRWSRSRACSRSRRKRPSASRRSIWRTRRRASKRPPRPPEAQAAPVSELEAAAETLPSKPGGPRPVTLAPLTSPLDEAQGPRQASLNEELGPEGEAAPTVRMSADEVRALGLEPSPTLELEAQGPLDPRQTTEDMPAVAMEPPRFPTPLATSALAPTMPSLPAPALGPKAARAGSLTSTSAPPPSGLARVTLPPVLLDDLPHHARDVDGP